jgi:hypothetical protein
MIATRLHPADVIAHDEEDVWFLVCRLCAHGDKRGVQHGGPIDEWFLFHDFIGFGVDRISAGRITTEKMRSCP